jgi:transcription termination factor NusB
MPVSPARAAAFDILLRVERESSYASELLHSAAYQSLSTPDHALATEIVMGVLRWRSRLDDEIATASSQPLPKLDLEILLALRIGVYQFRWLNRIPSRAALNESVELVKRARKRSAAPFVNAVLRKLSVAARQSAQEETHVSSEALARAYAHPQWLVERWAQALTKSASTINPFRRQQFVSVRQRPKSKSFKKESSSPPVLYSNPPATSQQETSRKRMHSAPAKSLSRTRPRNLSPPSSAPDPESSTAAPLPVARLSPSPTAIPRRTSPPSNSIPTARASSEKCCPRKKPIPPRESRSSPPTPSISR